MNEKQKMVRITALIVGAVSAANLFLVFFFLGFVGSKSFTFVREAEPINKVEAIVAFVFAVYLVVMTWREIRSD